MTTSKSEREEAAKSPARRWQPVLVFDWSISRRLPLLIGTVLFVIIMVSTYASYQGVKDSAFNAAHERLAALTTYLAEQLQQQGAAMTTRSATLANDPKIRAFLQSPSQPAREAAVATVKQMATMQDTNNLQIELWSAAREPLLTIPETAAPERADLNPEFHQSEAEPFKTVGTIQIVNGAPVFPVVAATRDDRGKPIGYLVRWRKLSGGPEGRKQLTDLVGNQAVLYVGNSKADVWTDLVKQVPRPPVALPTLAGVSWYTRDGEPVMALGRSISGTPWFLAIEFPTRPLLAQANQFLRRTIFTSLFLLGIGVAASVLLSRTITRPLQSLTQAASAISAGDYSHTAKVRRNNELGALAAAFNTMVRKLRQANVELEQEIQERDRTGKALRESEERLQTVIENLDEGLVISELNGQLIHWNRSALDIHGFHSIDECLLRLPEFEDIFELSTTNGRIITVEEWPLARIIRGERLRNLELRVRRIDSDWSRVFSYGGDLVREPSGRQLAFVTITDITERRRAEEALQTQASLFEQSYDAVFVWDWKGPITFWNRGAERLYGFKSEDALGKISHQLLKTRSAIGTVEAVLQSLEKRSEWEGELEHTTRDGRIITVESRMALVREQDHHYVLETTHDITDRKRGQEALAESERQYRYLFESNPLPMWVFDLETLKFLAVNQAAIKHYGFGREEFLKMTLKDVRPAEEVPTLMEAVKNYAKGLSRSRIWKHRKKTGEVIDVEITAHPIDFDGRPAELVLANDVTDRLRAQEALRAKSDELAAATQQLWQASKLATMGELAASIAHELNNPLGTIALRVESLAGAVAGDERKERSVEIVSDEVERMAKLVGNLLQFSRRSHAQISTVNVGEEIRNSVEFIHYYLRNRKVNVIYDLADDLLTVPADRQQLRQLFLNLLTNASDAMPHGGNLTVRTTPGELPEHVDAVVAELVDTGVGISTDDLENIWEPFFTTKPEGKGTGLGLAICRRVVEEHRGTITIKSSVGEGTTVRILLPATNGIQRTLEVAAQGLGENVLVNQ